jgi:diaminohydroxyphosphoribosylaminopyrimidine deaminase/5-amino-6-(5-phosphoribosylamino)uracil reductase
MREALALAERGRGRVRPNPVVGALVVQRGRVVGRGFHRRLGGPHAEIEALREAGAKARGATLYVTLEPCVHQGRTGPCVPAVLEAGVARVVAAAKDPFPQVRGRGFRWLRRAGVGVESGLLEVEARDVNAGYFSVWERGRPRLSLKLAVSLDGRIAPARGPARWITGEAARRAAHHLRARHDVVLVGANTVRRDDPALTVRDAPLPGRCQPLRLVVSSDLALPPSSRLFSAGLAAGTVVATVAPEHVAARERRVFEARARRLARRGVGLWFLPRAAGGVDLGVLGARLAAEGRHDVLVEGGATLGARLADLGLVDELWLFTAPVLLGGGAPAWRFGERPTALAAAWRLARTVVVPLGADWVVHGRPERPAARRGTRPSRARAASSRRG